MSNGNKNEIEKASSNIMEATEEAKRIKTGISELESILNDTATPQQLKKWLLDICEASDIRVTKTGEQYTTPNWDARIKGWDRVMQVLRYVRKETPGPSGISPTKIVIQVIENKSEVVDISPIQEAETSQ